VGALVKPQAIRAADVLLLAPFMLWAGSELARRRPVAGALLALAGVLTAAYNGHNFARCASSAPPLGCDR
jgi:hypothetical protein